MEEENSSINSNNGVNKKGLIITIVAVILILAIAGGGFAFINVNKSQELKKSAAVENVQNQAQITPAVLQRKVATSTNTFRDGSYQGMGTYSYHSGTESIKVSLTLKDGKVQDINVITLAKAPTSKVMQADFAANYKTFVIGKNIDEVKLGKVSGSSLTPIGFNAAIEEIKSKAKS